MQDLTNATSTDQSHAPWLSAISISVCFAVSTIFSIIGVQIKKGPGTQRDSVRPS